MIHVASLIHDDVLDEAEVRRGGMAVHKLYSNKVAVLAGDYLLARASVLLARLNDVEVSGRCGKKKSSETITRCLVMNSLQPTLRGTLDGCCCGGLGGCFFGISDMQRAALRLLGVTGQP